MQVGTQIQKETWAPQWMGWLFLAYIDLRSLLLCLNCSDCGSGWSFIKLWCKPAESSPRLKQSSYRYFNPPGANESSDMKQENKQVFRLYQHLDEHLKPLWSTNTLPISRRLNTSHGDRTRPKMLYRNLEILGKARSGNAKLQGSVG